MGMSSRLCTSANGALLPGEEAIAACTGRATRPEGSGGMSARIPTDQDVAVVATTHRLLVFKTGYAGRVGQPLFGVGPHNLRRVEVSRHGGVNGRLIIEFLDLSTTTVEIAALRQVGRMKEAVDRLIPVAA